MRRERCAGIKWHKYLQDYPHAGNDVIIGRLLMQKQAVNGVC